MSTFKLTCLVGRFHTINTHAGQLITIVTCFAFKAKARSGAAEKPGAEAQIVGLKGCFQLKCSRMSAPDIEILEGYIPGSIGRVAELHGRYYAGHWGFSSFFEAKVASELAEFIRRYEPDRDGFWTAFVDGVIEGSITLDGLHAESEGAHLRWFIVAENMQGLGIVNIPAENRQGNRAKPTV